MEQSPISVFESDCVLMMVSRKSVADGRPLPIVFANFATFLAWRRQNLSDILSAQFQTVPYICEEVVDPEPEPAEPIL